ncbi:MAG: thioredoxin-like domain-containing protein [Ignavibacteria bacterium]|jgi:thiol-disulfide isomerase/thioredoxin
MLKFIIAKVLLILLILSNVSCGQNKGEEETPNLKYLGNITAPEFPSGLQWLNTDRPLTLKEFKGKLVLLDFWTYCCINCMHIIPDLKKLEKKYKDELVVIGVHSAKFLTEQGTDNIRQAILRYEIEHPVVNDKDLRVWNLYTASSWPTLVLIDPKGKIIDTHAGEGAYDAFDPVISQAIQEYDQAGNILDRKPVKFNLEKNNVSQMLLSFPGKVTADASSSRLFITDSDNKRVLVLKLDPSGENVSVEEVIGSGIEGKKDGSFTDAEFFRPQGIAYHNDILYIADTENHLIREIDLKNKIVKTIAGLGYQSRDWGWVSGKASETALNSPWDLLYLNDALYIAMAGPHQLWRMDLKTGIIGTYAGSGFENIRDGSFESAALAQPSGITTDGIKLYFADSEVSAVRTAELGSDGRISTIVGQGLFDFGDIDGTGKKVRLQHPLGIVYNPEDKLLYVADTYNSKIKVINPETKESRTYSGTGVEGHDDGVTNAQFNEPSGLTILNGKIYITDTNNHLLRVIDTKTREVKTVKFTNPEMLTANRMSSKKVKPENIIKLDEMNVKEGLVKLKFNFKLPDGFKINPEAQPQLSLSSDGNVVLPQDTVIETHDPMFEYPAKIGSGKGNLNVEVLIYYCEDQNIGVCKFKDLYFEIPLSVNSKGNDFVNIDYTLN